MYPDSSTVLAALAARLGRPPSLIEMLDELLVEPSGTPAVPDQAPAPDSLLTLMLRLQELQRRCPLRMDQQDDQEGPFVGFPQRGLSEGGVSPFPIKTNGVQRGP